MWSRRHEEDGLWIEFKVGVGLGSADDGEFGGCGEEVGGEGGVEDQVLEDDLGGDGGEDGDVKGDREARVGQLGVEEGPEPLEVLAGGRQGLHDGEELLEGERELGGHPHLASVGLGLLLDGLRRPHHAGSLRVGRQGEGGVEVLLEGHVLLLGLGDADRVASFAHLLS